MNNAEIENVLSDNFTPQKATIPQLKSILSQFNVKMTSAQKKKADFVQLFDKEVAGKRASLKKKYLVKPSNRGIQNVNARGQQISDDEEEEEEQLNPFQKRRSISRNRSRSPSLKRSPSKSPKKSSKKSQQKSAEYVEEPTFKKQMKIAGYVNVQQLEEQIRRKQAKSIRFPSLSQLLLYLVGLSALLTMLAALAQLVRYNQLPYCEQPQEYEQVLGVPLEMPVCQQCPVHAICGNEIDCKPGYLLSPQFAIWNPLKFVITPTCVPDTLKNSFVEKFRQAATEIVSTHAGEVECKLTDADIWLYEDDVREQVAQKFRIPEKQRFDDYWNTTIHEIRFQQSPLTAHIRGKKMVFTSSEPHYPPVCRLLKFSKDLVASFRYHLIAILVGAISAAVLYFKVIQSNVYNSKIMDYSDMVKKLLIDQEGRFRIQKTESTAAVSQSQLRDFVLTKDYPQLKKRSQVWNDVLKCVTSRWGGAFVRECQLYVEGEVHDGLQWIGQSVFDGQDFHSPKVAPKKSAQQLFELVDVDESFEGGLYPTLK